MSWVQEELGSIELGDKRREKRLIEVVERLASQPQASIPSAAQGWAETKAAYRLMEHPALDWRAVLEKHAGRTQERILQYKPKVVLCIQDTTELDFSSQPGRAGLGRLNYEARRGMYVHPTVVTPEGLGLGVIDAWRWARQAKGEAEFKESIRWIEGDDRVAEMAGQVADSRLVYLADREGDFRELFDRGHELGYGADILVRAMHKRKTADGGKLWEKVENSQALGDIELVLPAD